MTPDRPAAPVTDAYVIAMRNAFAEVCADAKAELPDCNREVIDKIADTLDLIPADAVPDFIGLDGTTNGAVSALIREDIRSVAGVPTLARQGLICVKVDIRIKHSFESFGTCRRTGQYALHAKSKPRSSGR